MVPPSAPSLARAQLCRTTTLAILSFLLLLVLVHLIVFPNDDDLRLQEEAFASSSPCSCSSSVRVFLGVLTVPERRAHLRLAFCDQLDKEEEEQRVPVAMEIVDVLILLDNRTETMDKTYFYFSAVARKFAAGDEPSYDLFVGKTDADTHYYRLADALRDSMYHGRFLLTPCHASLLEWQQYVSGTHGYVAVSWEMAEWISAIRNDQGCWEVNFFRHEHDVAADSTVPAHKRRKDRLEWARTLFFFNGAQALQSL